MPLGDIHKKLYSNENEQLRKRRLADDFFNPLRKDEQTEPVATGQPQEAADPANAPETANTAEVTSPKAAMDDSSLTKVSQDVWLSPEDAQMQESTEDKVAQTKHKFLKLGGYVLGGAVLLVLAVLGVVKWREATFSEERLLMEITGPSEIKSGQEVSYDVVINNQNRVDLTNVVLKLSYPQDLMVQDQSTLIKEGFSGAKIEIGKIASKETKRYTIKAKTYGPDSNQIYFNGSLLYQPSNMSTTFEKKAQLSGIIHSSLLKINLVTTQDVAAGEDMDIQVLIKNEGSEAFTDVDMKMEYPVGFTYTGSDRPVTQNDQLWSIGTVEPGQQVKMVVSGNLGGTENSYKSFKALIGKSRSGGEFLKYSEADTQIKIVAPRMVIQQTVNGKSEYYANAGENLEFVIKFKNNTNVPLRELVLKEKITSPVIDKSKMQASGAHYDSNTETITWRAADMDALHELSPGEEAEVKFRAVLLDKFPMATERDKNFIISSQASLESLDINSPLPQNKRVFSNSMAIKVNSRLVLDMAGYYNDSELPNDGPIPMRVGDLTTFTLRMNLLNTSNDLKNVVLSTSLAPGVTWRDSYQPEVSGLEYNDRTNELIWNMGTLQAGTGFLLPVKALAFQVGVTPSANQVNQPIILLNAIKITAVDTFTGQQVEYKFNHTSSTDIKDLATNDTSVSAE